jgi:hypothetical protein
MNQKVSCKKIINLLGQEGEASDLPPKLTFENLDVDLKPTR